MCLFPFVITTDRLRNQSYCQRQAVSVTPQTIVFTYNIATSHIIFYKFDVLQYSMEITLFLKPAHSDVKIDPARTNGNRLIVGVTYY